MCNSYVAFTSTTEIRFISRPLNTPYWIPLTFLGLTISSPQNAITWEFCARTQHPLRDMTFEPFKPDKEGIINANSAFKLLESKNQSVFWNSSKIESPYMFLIPVPSACGSDGRRNLSPVDEEIYSGETPWTSLRSVERSCGNTLLWKNSIGKLL